MKNATGNKMLQSNLKKQLMMLLTLSLLFGLGWSFGLAATNSLPVPWLRFSFEVIFLVLTAFQGLFIFILYCARLKKVRKVWLKWFYMLSRQHSKAMMLDLSRSTHSTRNFENNNTIMKMGSFGTSASTSHHVRQSSSIKLKKSTFLNSSSSATHVNIKCTSPDSSSSFKSPNNPSDQSEEDQITNYTVKTFFGNAETYFDSSIQDSDTTENIKLKNFESKFDDEALDCNVNAFPCDELSNGQSKSSKCSEFDSAEV